jgi:hypothetical protein
MRKVFALLLAVLILTSTSNAFSVDATPSPSPSTVPSAATSLEYGNFVVGDTGPGGGLIFYVSSKGFKCGPTYSKTGSPEGGLCHYLEVAPNGWKTDKGSKNDPHLYWAVKSKQKTDVVGIPDEFASYPAPKISISGIGLGYKNSIAIIKQGNDANTAAGASRAYNGGSKNDWYLPTLAEANALCKWLVGVPSKSPATVCEGGTLNSPTYGAGISGFIASYYLTSSEHINISSPKNLRHQDIWALELFETGLNSKFTRFGKYNSTYVRPIRAF